MANKHAKRIITAEEIKQCEAMAGLRLTLEQMGRILNVSKSTMDRRVKEQPELQEAIERGRAQASAKVRQMAYKMATSGKHPVMTIFWLKCQEGFRERDEEDRQVKIVLGYEPKAKRVKDGDSDK